jgi:putative hydrolase of the HAD superfamily
MFDLGGVLIDNATYEELPKLLPTPIDASTTFERWAGSAAVHRFERGEIDADAFAASFVEEWDLAIAPAAFLAEFAGWPRGPYPGAMELLADLKGRFEIAILSNCNAVHWARLSEIVGQADRAFSSHLRGRMKPDAALFDLVVRELGRPPGEICFFDDSLRNVTAARAAGMKAYQTVGFEALREMIGSLGLESGAKPSS